MAERPILFSGPLVRAILAGRKTETRRLMKPQPIADPNTGMLPTPGGGLCAPHVYSAFAKAPALIGDRLWVRERIWQSRGSGHMAEWGEWEVGAWSRSVVRYHATEGEPETTDLPNGQFLATRPSIHMPKWAARIWLDVTEVRAERLQEIDDAGALAEGIGGDHSMDAFAEGLPSGHYRSRFQLLWDSIYGKSEGSAWSDNPWVWVVKFEREESGR